ncbi:MAG: hypothetical protein CM15mP66_00010 [Pseudomonadota bacterium]|nr:MAG: hypothetical protein CM15mP66_00010 [Pseudomonadota bacterium]
MSLNFKIRKKVATINRKILGKSFDQNGFRAPNMKAGVFETRERVFVPLRVWTTLHRMLRAHAYAEADLMSHPRNNFSPTTPRWGDCHQSIWSASSCNRSAGKIDDDCGYGK